MGRLPQPGSTTRNTLTQLYQNILGRAPDSGGLAYWQASLASGTDTRATAAAAFAGSSEAQTGNAAQFAGSKVFGADPNAVETLRGYETVLGRSPEVSGLAGFTAALDNGSLTVANAYTQLVSSQEFAQRLGGKTDNASFVKLLSQTVYGGTNSTATQFWSDALASGQVTRGGVAAAFAHSAAVDTLIGPLVTNTGVAHV